MYQKQYSDNHLFSSNSRSIPNNREIDSYEEASEKHKEESPAYTSWVDDQTTICKIAYELNERISQKHANQEKGCEY